MKTITLTNSSKVAVVDNEDYEKAISVGNWLLVKGYARSTAHPLIYLHHLVFGKRIPRGKEIDHEDTDRLNCRKRNLRIATKKQNHWNRKCGQVNNTSGYKGVHFYKPNGVWVAYIRKNSKRRHLGYFETRKEAAIAYNLAATKLFGRFAKLNIIRFPRSGG